MSFTAPDLSNYLNFRQYLGDFYKYKLSETQKLRRPYSYSTFSAAANIRSPNYLKLIIDGKRNLSLDMCDHFSKALGHSKTQGEEFKLLVEFNQESDPVMRNVFLKQLNEIRVQRQIDSGAMNSEIWKNLPSWISWVLYALTDQKGVEFDVEKLKLVLKNKANEHDIRQAMEGLLTIGQLVKDPETGKILKAQAILDSLEEIPVALVRKLQAELVYLGLESLYQDSPLEREFGSLTLCMTKKEFDDLKFKLRHFRKALNKDNNISRLENKGERVYQLNIQLFPITDKSPEVHQLEDSSVYENAPAQPATAPNLLSDNNLNSEITFIKSSYESVEKIETEVLFEKDT
ncbi:MAG TPA: TIGR02147 family protein [Pseudobdellovibrionaceae bacterium]|nr:TIGR02147 family protein [Pseudobdellovibrionaceae bacterium]